MTAEEYARMQALAATLPAAERSGFGIEYGGPERPETASYWTIYHTLPEAIGMMGSEWTERVVGPMRRVGDALLGQSGYRDLAEFQKDVLDAVGAFATPGMAFSRPSMTGLGIFGGLGAKNARPRMQQVAERAVAAGKDPDEVRQVTGWFKGMDDKWRFEVDDSAMRLNPKFEEGLRANKGNLGLFTEKTGGEYRLPEVISHPGLFEQYPELAYTRVRFDHPKDGGASFDASTNMIHLPKSGTDMGVVGSWRDSLTHEIQHWVQKKEGFARGGSAEKVGPDNYTRLAGEIEARDAAGRRTWDAAMREAVPPDLRKDAIIRFGNDADFNRQVLKDLELNE